MKLTLLFLLTLAALRAQNPLYLDLAGDWRTILADDPAYARPDFDDSGWAKYRLPSPDYGDAVLISRYRWLRRSLVIPTVQSTDNLVLTVGGFRRKYEVFVNGVRIGEKTETSAPAAMMFPVPSGILRSGEPNGIALRALPAPTSSGALRVIPNAGPFLLTNQVNAPVWVIAADHERRTRFVTPSLAAALLYSILALLLFLAWLGNRGELSFASLAGSLGLEAVFGFSEYYAAFTGAGDPPLGFLSAQASISLQVYTLLNEMRIDRRVCGAAALFLFGALFASNMLGIVGLYGILLFGFGWLVYQWGRLSGRWAIFLALLSVVFLATTRVPSSLRLFLPASTIGGFYIRAFDCVFIVLALVLVVLLMRRLLADRVEKQRLHGELESARIVQQLLLPQSELATPTCTLEAVYESAQQVGGDFYWHRLDSDGSLLLVVGDVSGKGLKAAMLVSVAVGILRNEKSTSPAAILAALNDGFTGHTGGGFVTCCCARFGSNGKTTFANAGHPSPYCDGRELEVEAGLPLGVMPGMAYGESVVRGERFTFVSDGVIEAENAQRELFGFDRTREISMKSAQEIADVAQAWGQNDDITVVTVRRKP